MASPVTDTLGDKGFLASKVLRADTSLQKRRLQEVKMDLMNFSNYKSTAKASLTGGKFGEAIVAYTKALDTVSKIVNMEAGQAASNETIEEEEIRQKQLDDAKWEKFNGEGPGELPSPKELQYARVERSKVRALQLSKRLKKLIPLEHVVKLYLGRGACFSKMSEHRRAVEDANSALSLDTMCIKAYIRRGEALMQLQQYREASDSFRSGLQVDPCNRALKEGFQNSLEGLRVQWHQYFPTYGHTNASTEIAGDPTDAPTGIHQFSEAPVDPADAQHDGEVAATVVQAGMVFEVTDILKIEAQWWSTYAARFMGDVNNARDLRRSRTELLQLLMRHRSDLMLLFNKYCEVQYGERLSRSARVSQLVVTGSEATPHPPAATNHVRQSPRTSAIMHLRPAYTPKSERQKMSMSMCKRLFLECKLISKTFGSSLVEKSWQVANGDMLNSPRAVHAGRPSGVDSREKQQSSTHHSPKKSHGLDDNGFGADFMFPKFLEVLVRVIFSRYKPMNADTGIKPPTLCERIESALNKHFIPSAVAIRAAAEAGTASTSLAIAEDDASWASQAVVDVMDEFRPRLTKVFDFFAVHDRASKRMDILEFLYMMKSLGLAGTQRSDLHVGCKVFASVVGYVGAPELDKMDLDQFIESLGRCGDISTHDGMVALPSRLSSFFSNVVLQKAKHKTDIAALWL